MTYFHEIPPIEERALALPLMAKMLTALADMHAGLNRKVTQDRLWKAVSGAAGKDNREGREAHIYAAREAGFVDEVPSSGNLGSRLSLTDKGYAAIGAKRPFWEGAA